jgi:hypothetical protein
MQFGLRILLLSGAIVCTQVVAHAQHQNLLPNAIQPGSIHIGLQTIETGLTAPEVQFTAIQSFLTY